MIFKIPSSTTDQIHYVDVLHNTCTCHSFTHSHKDCKHIKFVHAENEAGTLSLGKITREDFDILMGITSDKLRYRMSSVAGKTLFAEMDDFSKIRLSKNFIMRDFLHSNYNSVAGIHNYPENPKVVIAAGKKLCEKILEPIITKWGKVFITFGYQSRAAIEMDDVKMKTKPKASCPHQWDRMTYGVKTYCRVDILPVCVLDGEVSKREFGEWVMDNLDVDLLMCWEKSFIFCITYSEYKPRRVFLEWVTSGAGDAGSNKKTFRGEHWWRTIFPRLLKDKRPVFHPSMSEGKMWHDR